MANEKFTVVGTNIQEKATMIWNVADLLRGPFKPHEYGLVILPMTVVKRFHDCLRNALERYSLLMPPIATRPAANPSAPSATTLPTMIAS